MNISLPEALVWGVIAICIAIFLLAGTPWFRSQRAGAVMSALMQVTLISVPLFVYFMFLVLVVPEKGGGSLLHKPEWMFIALMLQAEAMRDSVAGASRAGLFEKYGDNVLISEILYLIIVALTLFASLGRYEGVFKGPPHFDLIQLAVLVGSLYSCFRGKYLAALDSLERKKKESDKSGT